LYNVVSAESFLDIAFDGAALATGLAPQVTLDDGHVLSPALAHSLSWQEQDRRGERFLHQFVYAAREGDDAVTLVLGVTCYDDLLVASVGLRSGRRDEFGRRVHCVAPVGGIRLVVAGLGQVDGLLAHYMGNPWWTRPCFAGHVASIPPRTQSLLWRTGHIYHHLLPVCGDVFKTELCGDERGLNVIVSAYDGGYSDFETVAFVLASGSNPFDLSRRTAAGGLAALGTPFRTREYRRFPELFEYVGWCSWDAFYYQVNAAGILEKAQEFSAAGLPIRWLIVDAGWSDDVNDTYLGSFRPHPRKFPGGFAPLIEQLKDEYGLRWVGAWHTITGYWNGVHRNGLLAQEMWPALYASSSGKLIPAPEAEKGFSFWNAWHAYLRSEGIDFVKVDHQGALALILENDLAIGKAAKGAHAALEASVGSHFDNRMINCMGMASENVWHRPISPLARNSEDFCPQRPGQFKEHALQNAYNAYYHAPFTWLDFDMWWTRHDDAANHAVLRAVSGGPVYVSDPVGETDPAVLWPLMLADGRVLRCDRPGLPTEDCLLRDPQQETVPLKVWNRFGEAGLVAAFHVHPEAGEVTGSVGPRDVPGLAGEQFVVFEHFTCRACLLRMCERLDLSLQDGRCALYVLTPLAGRHTPIGLIDKYVSPATIMAWRADGERMTVLLKEGGVFAWVSAAPPSRARVNGEEAAPRAGDGIYTVDCTGVADPAWIEIE
jgi:hypothetical protein